MPATLNPLDIAILTLIDKDLKSCASFAATSACECTTPQLRAALAQISQQAIVEQERLAMLASQKGVYVPPRADQTTIDTLMPQLQAAVQGLGGTAPMVAPTNAAALGGTAPVVVPNNAASNVAVPRLM